MVGNNNSTILTVSYGTFSCTLEGFEDSFETMKAIAEYFRDLAADDRFFGAEPPTPDTEMLARIAEKEAARKVQAVSHDGGITLRPYRLEDAAPVAAEAPAVEKQAEPAEETTAYTEDEDNADSFFQTPAQPSSQEESVAARLQRIREAAAHAPVEPVAASETAQEDLATKPEETEPEQIIEDVSSEELHPDDAYENEMLAALLDDEDDLEEEPDTAKFEEATDDVELDTLLEDISDEETDVETEPDSYSEDDEELAESPDDTQTSPIRTRVLHVKRAVRDSEPDDTAADLDDYDEESDPFDAEDLNAIFDDEVDFETDVETSLSPEDEEDLMRELAAVEASDDAWGDPMDEETEVEVKDGENLFSNDPEEALAKAQDLSSLLSEEDRDSEVNRLMAETESQLSSPDTDRRHATIAHLKAAVASKRADGDEGDGNADNADSAAYKADLIEAVKPTRPALTKARTERAAQPPLKLVAAQRIAPEITERAEPAQRPTLVKPVRPRRIRATASAAAEAAAMLDDDLQDPQEAQAPALPHQDFAAFAEHMEADKLPELMEAAASYVTFVEGLEKFSRPQVMTRVRTTMGEDFSREDGLRAFGQLLREGKILKLDGGRFTASDSIGFQPE